MLFFQRLPSFVEVEEKRPHGKTGLRCGHPTRCTEALRKSKTAKVRQILKGPANLNWCCASWLCEDFRHAEKACHPYQSVGVLPARLNWKGGMQSCSFARALRRKAHDKGAVTWDNIGRFWFHSLRRCVGRPWKGSHAACGRPPCARIHGAELTALETGRCAKEEGGIPDWYSSQR